MEFRHDVAKSMVLSEFYSGFMRPLSTPGKGSLMSKHKTALSDTLKQEFQKDLDLFKYFLLLMNSSSPIRNVELMWVEDLDPSKALHKERVNTEDALVQLQLGTTPLTNRNSPSTLFCDFVHGFGAHEETT